MDSVTNCRCRLGKRLALGLLDRGWHWSEGWRLSGWNFFRSERYWFIFHIVFAVVIKEIVSDNTKTFSKISICCHQKNAEKFISSLRSSRMVKIYRIFSNSPKNNKNNSALSAVTVNCHSARFVGLIHWMQKHIVLSDPGG